jgi:folate-binding Fe-S cluster repair protein YgfZ
MHSRVNGILIKPGLQGLLTNDVTGLDRVGAQPIYAALLNPQGRHLHEIFLNRAPGQFKV